MSDSIKTLSESPSDELASSGFRTSAVHDRLGCDGPVVKRIGSECADRVVQQLRNGLFASRSPAMIGVVATELVSNAHVTTANLAIRLADHSGVPVLLVDCDSNQNGVRRLFQVGPKNATDDLTGIADYEIVSAMDFDCLDVLCVNEVYPATVAAGDSITIEKRLVELQQQYPIMVLNLPKIDESGQWQKWFRPLDGVVMVVKSGDDKAALAKLHKEIKLFGIDLAAVIMTGQKSVIPTWLERLF